MSDEERRRIALELALKYKLADATDRDVTMNVFLFEDLLASSENKSPTFSFRDIINRAVERWSFVKNYNED